MVKKWVRRLQMQVKQEGEGRETTNLRTNWTNLEKYIGQQYDRAAYSWKKNAAGRKMLHNIASRSLPQHPSRFNMADVLARARELVKNIPEEPASLFGKVPAL
eukprot:186859-Hanusia_phi.AAC.1